MDAIFSGVFTPATIILSVAVSVSVSNIYISFVSSYWDILLLLVSLLIFLIKYITSFILLEHPTIFIL